MLKPYKHSNPNKSVIAVSSVILALLIKRRLVCYDDLYGLVKKKFSGADVLFAPSISFLYSFGLVEYQAKTDAFEYIEKNKQ